MVSRTELLTRIGSVAARARLKDAQLRKLVTEQAVTIQEQGITIQEQAEQIVAKEARIVALEAQLGTALSTDFQAEADELALAVAVVDAIVIPAG